MIQDNTLNIDLLNGHTAGRELTLCVDTENKIQQQFDCKYVSTSESKTNKTDQ